MQQENNLAEITHLVGKHIAAYPDVFLVEVRIKPTNNIKVFLDADEGLRIDRCASINRALYKQIEESNRFPDGNFSLEVSSPGIGEPLKLLRQYIKNIGRRVELTLDDESRLEGTLLAADEQQVTVAITTGKKKKEQTENRIIPMKEIRQTKILIAF
jgi:ribosome maturation factor RimP